MNRKLTIKSKPKKMWKTLKSLIGGKDTDNTKGIYFGETLYSGEDKIADMFNDFYLQSIENIVNRRESNGSIAVNQEQVNEVRFEKFKVIKRVDFDKIVCNLRNRNGMEEGINTE